MLATEGSLLIYNLSARGVISSAREHFFRRDPVMMPQDDLKISWAAKSRRIAGLHVQTNSVRKAKD